MTIGGDMTPYEYRCIAIAFLTLSKVCKSTSDSACIDENDMLLVLCKLRVFHLRLRLRQKKLRLREKNSGSGRKHVKIEI